MVKIKVDEDKKRDIEFQTSINNIFGIIPHKYRLEYNGSNETAFHADIVEPFRYTKRKYIFWKEVVESTHGGTILGHFVLILNTNKINLHGTEKNLRDIAELLENNGYDVTIYV